MRHFKEAAGRFCRAGLTEHLVTWCGVHVTKLHVYLTSAGSLALLYWQSGKAEFGLVVFALALLDQSDRG